MNLSPGKAIFLCFLISAIICMTLCCLLNESKARRVVYRLMWVSIAGMFAFSAIP